MAAYSMFADTVTKLINARMGTKNEDLHVTKDEVEQLFEFGKLDPSNWLKLCHVMAEEMRQFENCPKLDDENVAELLALGLVKFVWREAPPEKEDTSEHDSSLRSAFLKMAAVWSTPQTTSELFVCFDIDKIVRYEGFAELTVLPAVARFVVEGLNITCRLKSLPVKACRRKDSNEMWCQLQCTYENDKSSAAGIADFARDHLGRSDRRTPKHISVFFAIDDAVDMENPWGSCPLLHVGTNFKTPEYSRWFDEVTDTKHDHNTSANTCFVYSQKNPTVEIPSKLNVETEIVMRGAIEDAPSLFGGQKRPSNFKLAAAMALSHPKSRGRHMANAFLALHLPRTMTDSTSQHEGSHVIDVGTDAAVTPPLNDGAPISRKMSIASYKCLACPGKSACTENERSRGHLSHGSSSGALDILANGNDVCKTLASVVSPPSKAASSKFTMRSCDRGAVSHNFFCEGVVPCSAPFSPRSTDKNTFVLFGKVVDVVNSRSAARMQKRVFCEKEDKNVPVRSMDAQSAFKDIVVHECDANRVKGYMRNNRVSPSVDCWKDRWMELVRLTGDFGKRVECFYKDLARASCDATCKRLFNEFIEQCKVYTDAKKALYGVCDEEEKASDAAKVFATLREHHFKNDAATSTLMHKSMFLGSRTVVAGARCVVSKDEGWKFFVRQYVVVMAGSVIAAVSTEDLDKFTPVKGAVSATTAPNDKLPDRAHQTWRDDDKTTAGLYDESTPSSKCENWRTAILPTHQSLRHKPPIGSRRLGTAPTTPRYVPPPLRHNHGDK